MTETLSGSSGFLLALLTESFAFRALLGSLAAAALAGGLVAAGLLRTRRARRFCVLTPAIVAVVAAVASINEAFLPQLWVAGSVGSAAGTLLDLFGDAAAVPVDRGGDVILTLYAAIVAGLLLRRGLGLLAVRRILRPGSPAPAGDPVRIAATPIAASMGLTMPRLLLLEHCPGGAFATGVWRPVVAVDPALRDRLDREELEGLLAHELAHVRRRDLALGLVFGVLRDLTFFLPPLHFAGRWLAREQEEGADELASAHTGRPVALASGILKVFAGGRTGRVGRPLGAACAAVPALASGPTLVGSWRGSGRALRAVTVRVERLIACTPAPSTLRRGVEALLAVSVLTAGAATAVVVPGWMVTELGASGLVFANLGTEPRAAAESPAFATFRELSAGPDATTPATTASAPPAVTSIDRGATGCVCVESQAELANRTPAVAPRSNGMTWGDRPAWEIVSPAERTARSTRPLWVVSERGTNQVGVFVLGAGEAP